MSVRQRYERLAPRIVSTAQIAEATGVGVSAVCNWTRRWKDFPAPLDTFGSTVLYAMDEVDDCLTRHGYTTSWLDRGETS